MTSNKLSQMTINERKANAHYYSLNNFLPFFDIILNILLNTFMDNSIGGGRCQKVRRHAILFPLLSPPFLYSPSRAQAPPLLPLAQAPPSPLTARGSGERCKLPQRGQGRSPSRQRFLEHSMTKSYLFWPFARDFTAFEASRNFKILTNNYKLL